MKTLKFKQMDGEYEYEVCIEQMEDKVLIEIEDRNVSAILSKEQAEQLCQWLFEFRARLNR